MLARWHRKEPGATAHVMSELRAGIVSDLPERIHERHETVTKHTPHAFRDTKAGLGD